MNIFRMISNYIEAMSKEITKHISLIHYIYNKFIKGIMKTLVHQTWKREKNTFLEVKIKVNVDKRKKLIVALNIFYSYHLQYVCDKFYSHV